MANTIQVAPWKISFLPTGNGPYAVKVRLYDLLFNSANAGAAWYLTNGAGLNLPHDILLFDPSVYLTTGGGTIDTAADRDTRQNHGVFLSKVTYDARSVKTWVANAFYAPLVAAGDAHNGQSGYYVYQSAASLPVLEADYSTLANKTYYDTSLSAAIFTDLLNPALPYDGNPADLNFNPYMCYMSSASLGVSGLEAATTSALIISSPDLALQATIPGSALQPFTKVCLRADTTNAEIVSILQFFTGYGITANGLPISGTSTSDLTNTVKNVHLLDVEVWVRCSFFADYVSPASFNQDLTPAAQVAHDNLLLGQGDFARFTRSAPSVDAPYIPMTPPRNDVLQITLVVNAAPFPIPPVTGTYSVPTATSNFPFGWANPELESGTIPAGLIAIPKIGNAYVSGRIFSPTIDELWIYIKKLVDGQGSGVLTGANPSIPAEPAISLPSSVTGDPLNAAGTTYAKAPASFTYTDDSVLLGYANATINIVGNSYATYHPTGATPRANPYSLRELEGLINNLQYNLRTTTGFFTANSVDTGNVNTTIGTLFELHRNYAPATPTNWQWTVANTYSAADITTSNGANYGSVLPQATSYNASANFLAGDSYLSADGLWHYLFDHVRLPVLAETY